MGSEPGKILVAAGLRVWKGAKETVTIGAPGRCLDGVINPSNGRGLSR
jgi:hypothetical protein